MQNEHTEDSPVPLTIDQDFLGIGQIPPTPAPSEQFVFPENFLTSQANADALTQPAHSIVSDTNVRTNTRLPNQPFPVMQAPLIEYAAYPNYPTLPPFTQTVYPLQQPKRKGMNTSALIAFSLAIVLVLISSCVLVFNLAYYQPLQTQLRATATSDTANAQATSTVNAAATTIGSLDASVTAQSQATAQAYQDLYQQATSGTPVLNNLLSQQTSNQWDEGTSFDKSSCTFENGSYHAVMPDMGFYRPCYENSSNFTNFAFQVDMTIVNGDRGGVLFRANHDTGTSYLLEIDTSGVYNLYVYLGFQASQSHNILSGFTNSMASGPNQITILAQGSTLSLYLNQQFLVSTTDATLTTGVVGVLADDYQHATEVTFSNAKVWLL